MMIDDVLNNEVAVTSSQTGFDLDYNRFHNTNLPLDVLHMRTELYRQRLSEAYFMYSVHLPGVLPEILHKGLPDHH